MPLVTPESHEQRCVMAGRTGSAEQDRWEWEANSVVGKDGRSVARIVGWCRITESLCACTIESCVCVARWLYQAYDGRGIGSGTRL